MDEEIPQIGVMIADEVLTVRIYCGSFYNPDVLDDVKSRALATFKEAWKFRQDNVIEIDLDEDKQEAEQQ